MDTILVTGASGRVGGAVAAALAEQGMNVRAATRDTKKIKPEQRVQPVAFDYENQGLYQAALKGVTGLFLVAPPLDPDSPAKLIPFIDKAIDMGIGYVVFNSVLKADSVERNPLRIIERHLLKSKIDCTILRPNFFMENFSKGWAAPMVAGGEITAPAGDGKTSFISVEDIATVATVCFKEKRPGEEYDLTGREALDYAEVARIISEACGREVSYKPISETELMSGSREQGMPESAVQVIVSLFRMVGEGLMAEITDAVRRVTGNDPISFREFTLKNADVWKMRKAA
jgi:uncharacterized protein YbjT (DUF2867 family)